MINVNNISLNLELASIVSNVWQYSQDLLMDFIKDPEFDYKITLAFEQPQISQTVSEIIQGWINGDVSYFPRIEVLPSIVLRGANGAYSSSNRTVYISSNFLSQNADNLPLLSSVLIEELGHYLNAELNSVDAPGDEGELFSAIIQRVSLGTTELGRIKTEDDHALVMIYGVETAIEQSLVPIPLIANYTGLRDPKDVRVVGNHAYIADFLSPTDFKVIDISNLTSPTLKSSFANPGNITDLDVIGNFAYGADGTNGLRIISVSNPLSPRLTSTFNTSGDAQDVKISGQYAYVADGSSGLQIINIANPSSPTFVSNAGINIGIIGLVAAVDIVNNYAYVVSKSGSTGRLQIINITNKSSPRKLGEYSFLGLDGTVNHISVVNNYAYIAAGEEGLRIVDVSNPSAPFLKGSYAYASGGEAFDVQVIGNYAFVAMGVYGLEVIDISNPSSPILAAYYDPVTSYLGQSLTNFVTSVEIFNKYAFLTVQAPVSTGGLWIVDVGQFTNSNIALPVTDFDKDGDSDILMHHSAWGANALLQMDGTNPQGWTSLPFYSGWTPVTSGDFDRDGDPDILMHHSAWGANALLQMNSTNPQGWTSLPFYSGWTPVTSGDFDRDGDPDILMHHSAWGANALLQMNGTNSQGWTSLPFYSGWTPVTSGDFDRDGDPDILLHHSAWGANAILTMNGTSPQGWASLPFYNGWTPVTSGDFDKDGDPDILLHHSAWEANAVLTMNGTNPQGWASLPFYNGWTPI
jgi:hypothetical protein